jgi:hypothetical protein
VPRRCLRLAVAGALAVFALSGFAATASADPPPAGGSNVVQPPPFFQAVAENGVPWRFSPYIPPNEFDLTGFGQDCRVIIGPVLDPLRPPDDPATPASFRLYGGVNINCTTVKSTIAADVVEQYCTSNVGAECTDTSTNWLEVGGRTSGSLTGTTGSGAAILVSPPICRGTATSFRTAGRVAIDQTVLDITSDPRQLTDMGCATGDEP